MDGDSHGTDKPDSFEKVNINFEEGPGRVYRVWVCDNRHVLDEAPHDGICVECGSAGGWQTVGGG